MNFQFDARTILELGKELISSDEIAIYELIKNAIDAGSESVEIKFEIRIKLQDFDRAVKWVMEGEKTLDEITTYIAKNALIQADEVFENFISDIRQENNRNEYLRVLNSWYKWLNKIYVIDTGMGMSSDDLNDIFLKVGTRSRRKENVSGSTYLGDKGIGRLSTMRLGNFLNVVTTKRGEEKWNVLEIDWNRFDCEEEISVNEIKIDPLKTLEKKEPNEQGTQIIIYDLNSNWTIDILKDIVKGPIARYINPFIPGLASQKLKFSFNGDGVSIPSIPKLLLDNAHATCSVNFTVNDCGNISVVGEMKHHLKEEPQKIESYDAKLKSSVRPIQKKYGKEGHAKYEELPLDVEILKNIGNFSIEIYWYNKKGIVSIKGLTTRQSESRNEINRWSGGIMIYRHDFRILPYGDPDDDWLGLDSKAIVTQGYHLNRKQIIGKVQISTPHKFVSEQTNREGLIESIGSKTLKNIVSFIVHAQFKNYIKSVDDEIEILIQNEFNENSLISKLNNNFNYEICKLAKRDDGRFSEEIKKIKNISSKLVKEYNKIEMEMEKFQKKKENDHEMFVYLSGVGLMTEFVFHELYLIVSNTIKLISVDESSLNISLLNDQLKTLEKRISSFDALATNKRQTKTNFDICETVNDILSFHEDEFTRHNIKVVSNLSNNSFNINAVRGMVIQIIENLIVNSSYWLKRQKEEVDDFSSMMEIMVSELEKTITVWDNGPGVPISQKEYIFQPFVTEKPIGMGKGLGLYIARDMAEHHGWKLTMTDYKQIQEGRQNSFVLQMK